MWRVKEEGRERLRLGVGGAAKRKGKGSKGMENEEWRGGEGKKSKGWKNVGILQQSGWCEGGSVRNVAGNARASSVCKKPHCNISHP